MKVAYLLNVFPALSETFVLNEILEMQEQGVEVAVFARCPRHEHTRRHAQYGRLKSPPIYLRSSRPKKLLALAHYAACHPLRVFKAWQLGSRKWDSNFKSALHIARLVERSAAQHIHCHFATTARDLGGYISALTGIPYTFTAHHHDIFFDAPANYKELAEAARRVITVSHFNKRYLHEHMEIPLEKIEVIRCGVDTDVFCPNDVHEKDIDILSVGRLHPNKGFPYLIEACAKLRRRGLPLRCTIVGDGKERGKLIQLAHLHQVTDCIDFTGAKTQTEVRKYMHAAKVFALPSVSEGVGVATMEALACEVPAVVTRVMGVPELVEDGVNGFLVPPRNPEVLADRLELLLTNPELRQRLGTAGREKVNREFHLATEVAKLKDIWFAKEAANV